MEDCEIIDLFFERSEQAITELNLKYGASVQKTAARILGDSFDIEECVNDALLQIWKTIPPQRPESLGAYACTVSRHMALNRYHANTAQKRNSFYDAALDELEDSIPSLSNVESEYDARELAEYVNRFLRGLSYDERYLFLRRYWYADAVPEIAKSMGLRENSVSVRLSRLRKKLNLYLKKEGMIV